MITSYINAALWRAHYELLEDNSYYGEIPGLDGVLANATTLEECRAELQEVFEGWILLGLQMGHELPALDGIKLTTSLELA